MNWPTVKLDELCHVVTKGTTPTSIGYEHSTEGVPFLRIQNLQGNTVSLDNVLFIGNKTHKALKRSIIKAGDLLITIAGTIGRTAIVPDDFPECNCNQAVAIIRFDTDRLLSSYLLYWLNSAEAMEQIAGKKVTATISNLSLGQIRELKIPLPPLETQKQIAAVLEKADQLCKDCKLLEQELNNLAQSVFIDMFGDPVTNPKGWPMKKLGEICKKITDGEHQNPTFIEDGYPMVMAKNVQEEGIDLLNTKKISLDDLIKFRKKCGAEKGDLLLVSRGATIGRCKEVDTTTDFALMGSVILMKPKVGLVSGAYLESIFRHPGIFSKLTKSSSASAQEAIYLKHVKDLVIPIPPKVSFEQLINFNLALDTMLIDLNIQLQEANQYFNALMQKAFNGELHLDNTKNQ